MTEVPPEQAPLPSQVSPVVQALESLQAVPAAVLENPQVPAEQVRVSHPVSEPGQSEADAHPATHALLEHLSPAPQSASVVHGGMQTPATQLVAQIAPQPPQLFGSVCVLVSQPFKTEAV